MCQPDRAGVALVRRKGVDHRGPRQLRADDRPGDGRRRDAPVGAEANVENSHFPHEVHDYGNTKRVPVYEFFARHLGLERLPLPVAKDVWPPREDVAIEPPEKLHVFGAAHPRPASALAGAEAIGKALAAARGK